MVIRFLRDLRFIFEDVSMETRWYRKASARQIYGGTRWYEVVPDDIEFINDECGYVLLVCHQRSWWLLCSVEVGMSFSGIVVMVGMFRVKQWWEASKERGCLDFPLPMRVNLWWLEACIVTCCSSIEIQPEVSH